MNNYLSISQYVQVTQQAQLALSYSRQLLNDPKTAAIATAAAKKLSINVLSETSKVVLNSTTVNITHTEAITLTNEDNSAVSNELVDGIVL